MRIFADRTDAGRELARELEARAGWKNAIVLALPRGGVPVAAEIARKLGLPLDVLVVRKLGVPAQPELAMGAIASGGAIVVNEEVLRFVPGGKRALEDVAARERRELTRREQAYRGSRPPLDVRGLTVILVDDGMATGASMQVAVQALRNLGAARVVVAIPTASDSACARVSKLADEVVCLETPLDFMAVGQWYADFRQTTDEEVEAILAAASPAAPGDELSVS